MHQPGLLALHVFVCGHGHQPKNWQSHLTSVPLYRPSSVIRKPHASALSRLMVSSSRGLSSTGRLTSLLWPSWLSTCSLASFEISPSILQCFSSSRGPCLQVAKPCQDFFFGVGCPVCFLGFINAKVFSAASFTPEVMYDSRHDKNSSWWFHSPAVTQIPVHGVLFSRKFHTSRSTRFELGQRLEVMSFTVPLTESVIAITKISHGTFPDDWLPSSGEITTPDARHGCER